MANNTTAPPMELDNSKRSTFVACPRKYLLSYILDLDTKKGKTALRYGSAWHGMMEGYYSDIKENGWGPSNIDKANDYGIQAWKDATNEAEYFDDDYRSYENCLTCFAEYIGHFASDRHDLEVIDTETMFKIRMKLSDDEFVRYPRVAKYGLFFTGKLDLHVFLSGQEWITEFKTTGQSIGVQISRLERTPQLIGYNWAANQIGHQIAGNLVSLHQISSRKSTVTEKWGKLTIKFHRQPHIYTTGDLLSWRDSFLYTAEKIYEAEEMSYYPMMYDSCYQFGPCKFTQLCNQNRPVPELDTSNYMNRHWNVLKTGHGDAKVEER